MNGHGLDKDQRRLIDQLRRTGPASRTQLAQALDFSAAYLTKLSRELLALGLLHERAEGTATGRGRPAVPLAIAAEGGFAVGASAHKGILDLALVDFAGSPIARHHETVAPMTPRDFAQRVRKLVHELVEKHGLLGRRMLGIGVAVPGPPMTREGTHWHAVDALPGWRDVPLRDLLAAEFNWPIWLENDANCAALAEFYAAGRVRDMSHLAVLLLGFGIGAGLIVDGVPLRGQHGAAGEIGCLYPLDAPRPSPLDLLGLLRAEGLALASLDDIDPASPRQAPVIARWMDRAAAQLEILVSTAFAWFDPGAIVLAGTLPRALLEGLHARLCNAPLATMIDARRPPLEVSRLEGSPVTLGAAMLPLHAIAS